MKKKRQWLVKDGSGDHVHIKADTWECGGNGLLFYVEESDSPVAWFISWQWLRALGEES